MRRRTRLWLSVLALSPALAGGAPSALAHEPRVIARGAYQLVVGFRNEPAFEDQVNAVDVFVRRADGSALGPDDRVELQVQVQLRADDAFDARVLAAEMLATPQLAFGTEDRYNAYFKPTADGAYGFRVSGVIHDASAGVDPFAIDETFVCRGGSRHPEGRSFGCIEDPQTFPGPIEKHTGRDAWGYRDTDLFSLD